MSRLAVRFLVAKLGGFKKLLTCLDPLDKFGDCSGVNASGGVSSLSNEVSSDNEKRFLNGLLPRISVALVLMWTERRLARFWGMVVSVLVGVIDWEDDDLILVADCEFLSFGSKVI